ncbi:hypothetical protein E2C01_068554 [Portunus trituberculatus]|uniref:Uncharacterized protein n=1 Tax=Portunus trituberculatus TaxID=210409 RepID=A0A5B7HSA4_PORTR|nr:hypothetical protein [Portunus trituberculatus]
MKRREDTGSCDVPGRWTALPFGLPVSDANHHQNKPDLRPRASQEAEQKQLELPLQSGSWRTHSHVYREKP